MSFAKCAGPDNFTVFLALADPLHDWLSRYQAREFVFLVRAGGDSQALPLTVWNEADISGDVWFVCGSHSRLPLLHCSHDLPPGGHMTRPQQRDASKVAGQVGPWSDPSHVMTARQLRLNQPGWCIFRFVQFWILSLSILYSWVYWKQTCSIVHVSFKSYF